MEYTIENLHEANDFIIHDIVVSFGVFESHVIELAEKIYLERNLDAPEKQALLKKFPILQEEALEALQKDSTEEGQQRQIQIFIKEGISLKEANKLIANLTERAKEEIISKRNGQAVLLFGLGVLLYFLRMWTRGQT